MTKEYALINKLTAKPGKRSEIIANLLESGKPFQDNPNCILYLVNEDANDPNIIWVEDLWTSKEEHSAALNAPEMRPFIAKTIPLLESMPEQMEVIPVGGKHSRP
jgi:quinol monooxygenase YgiN